MKHLLQYVLNLTGLFLPEPPIMDTSSFPSLPSDHPASIQLSSWLSAFNTQDKDTLLTYHNSNFSYTTVKSPLVDIDRELTFFEMTGGFHVADIEETHTPSKVVAVIIEKNERQNRHQYWRVEMEVDVEKENYPVTGFGIRAINTPLKLIPEDDPRRERYEKAYKTLTGMSALSFMCLDLFISKFPLTQSPMCEFP